jgi:two-component system chemotaxis sensor kinase CheA
MSTGDDDVLARLRATFRMEAHEHLQAMTSGLLDLERAGAQPPVDLLESVFRAAHSLKGAARAVNAGVVESLCQAIESVFSAIRRRTLQATAAVYDVLHRSLDGLAALLVTLDDGPTPAQEQAVAQTRYDLHAILADPGMTGASAGGAPSAHGAGKPPASEFPAGPPVSTATGIARTLFSPDSVRIRKRTLDAVLLQSEELLFAKIAASQRARGLRDLRQEPAAWRERGTRLRDDLRCIERAVAEGALPTSQQKVAWDRLREHVEAGEDLISRIDSDLLRQVRAAGNEERAIGQMVDQLLEEMKQMAVQPFSALFDIFPGSVRELARDCGKEVELVIAGATLEIDRRILDEIKDPLIHLVRNAIDHGIETPAVRRAAGKPPRGTLTIEASAVEGRQVSIVVRDDGAGFDAAALARAADKAERAHDANADIASDRLHSPATLTNTQLLALASQPGVSTSPLITDISGRGVGLSIVARKVERLTGTLVLESLPGQGACFRIVLPLTLARFRGVVLRLGRQWFVAPTRSVVRVARLRAEDVKTMEGRETVTLDGRVMAFARLARVLGVPDDPEAAAAAAFPVAVLNGAEQPVAFRVDEVLEEREVLVKPLGAQLESVRHVAGASVLGNGRVVPVLHVPDLLASAADGAGAGAARTDSRIEQRKSVLLAEDSITSRILLKGILESAGYRVETAADGVDAFTALRSGSFDLVVSDVDMPRLNGFGLTARIRADKKLADLPVVLVTALESREDREQGIDVGANAYIVKSSFDQSNLLEVVQRLL